MSCPVDPESLGKLKAFVDICKSKPELLHHPELSFFRNYIESLGGTVPQPSMSEMKEEVRSEPDVPPKKEDKKEEEEESDPESELEFDMTDCIDPDTIDENVQVMGDPDKEVTQEEEDQADEKRMEAMREFSSGNYEKAVECFGEAIKLNPGSALLFSKRGQAYLKWNKPNACIKDCSRALELNCDSAPAYKFRGRAYRLLGEWEKSAKDLRQAVKIDWDEQTDEWLKEVQPNAHKIEQHNIKLERKKALKEEKVKMEKIRMAREAHAKASSQAKEDAPPDMGNIYKLFQDPEILAAFQDPEVEAAFKDITVNPANMYKYQNNPKIQEVIKKLSSKFGAGAAGGGFGGGFPGAPNFPAGFDFSDPNASPNFGADEDPLD